jgi:transposase
VHRLFAIAPETLTSQDFWAQMAAVSGLAVEASEADLTRKVVHDFQLQLDTLFYDTSNFFPYLASGNERSTLAQRGHSKQKRFDLRQFSLALLVTRDGQLPLYADVYEGNTVDATRFPVSLTAIRQRIEHLVGHLADLTLVYDKGNNAKATQALVDELPVHYVASLVPSQPPDLTALPPTAYTPIGSGPLAKLPVYRCQQTLWGAERTVVLFLSSTLRQGQIRGLHQHLSQRLDALQQWQQTLAKPRSGPRTVASAQKQIERLLTGQYLRHILHIVYDPQRSGAERLTWWIDHAALLHLETAVFGKRIRITDQHPWSTEEIILAYRGQSRAEAVFRQLQDVDHLAVRPQYHWTDQKIRVHTFICLIALLLCRLVERECRGAGYQGSLSSWLDLLSTIRLALVLWPADTPKGHPRCTWLLEDCAPEAWQLYQHLVPPVPPFVYTSRTT